MGGFLDRGQKITVVFGDRSAGSPGWQMQTFCEDTFEFKTLVDPIATYEFKELPQSPTLRMVAGSPARAVCIAPSQVQLGEGFTYYLKLEDRWGNPAAPPVAVTHPGFNRAGICRLTAADQATGLSAASNPVRVADAAMRRLLGGSPHGQSEEPSAPTPSRIAHIARDCARVDACGIGATTFRSRTISGKPRRTTRNSTNRNDSSFPGYEWSGNTPLGGDRYLFTSEGLDHRSCTDLLPGRRDPQGFPTAPSSLKPQKRRRAPSICVRPRGRAIRGHGIHDPEVEIAVEVHSAWGPSSGWWMTLFPGIRISIMPTRRSQDRPGHPIRGRAVRLLGGLPS
jgi:hypothetical protein